jgi:hypothetical protein
VVFKAVSSFIADIAREGKTDFPRVARFYAEAAEADFLFGRDVIDLIETLYDRGVKLANLHEQLYPSSGSRGLPVGKERTRVAKKQSEMLQWFFDQFVEIKATFKKYLSVGR